ncbi:MAG: hypothetical protein IPM74_08965 [Crocinitomicaceae bacterium]|nr:hypothetical protein [Crocinitomicaceae bacterium]MBK8926021.1 hypothetical protein [Crocinitomicaceae bacterium]
MRNRIAVVAFIIFHFTFFKAFSQTNCEWFRLDSNFISILPDSATYAIHMNSSGCFHFSQDSIVVSRVGENYFLSYKSKTIQLTIEQIQKIKDFEYTLLHFNHGTGCTTADEYSISFCGFQILLLDDSSCSWNGMRNLLLGLGVG